MESSLNAWIFSSLVSFGFPLLLLVSYIGSLGIPFPITLVIVAAGALAHQGLLDARLALLACLAGAMLADHSEYILGRLALPRLRRRFEHKPAWQKAEAIIRRQGGWAILLTRFWLTPLAPAVNMIAGSRYPYARFLFFDLIGELAWVLLYGGLGFLFAGQWAQVSQAVSGFSSLSFAVVVLAVGVYWLWKRRQKAARVRTAHLSGAFRSHERTGRGAPQECHALQALRLPPTPLYCRAYRLYKK